MELPKETLLQLLELQKVDSTIDRLEARKRNLPEHAEVERIEAQLSTLKDSLAEQQVVVDEIAMRHSKMDTDVDLISQKIKSEEAKLYSGDVSNPKELSALQAEIESLNRRKSALEDAELEVMEAREGAEKVLATINAGVSDSEAALQAAVASRDSAAQHIDEDLAAQTEERERWAAKFEQAALEFYDELRTKRSGVAIAALLDGTCQGCKMRLPVQEVERVKSNEGLAYCDECRRVLVIVE
jgi:hypothetical protein